MSTPRWTRAAVLSGGSLIVLLGILHDVAGLPALRRAVARGELAERLAGPQIVNWLFSGAAMCLLGILVILAAWDLDRAGRLARRVIVISGAFFVALGLFAYAVEPRAPVLVFSLLGLILCVPLLAGAKQRRRD